MKFATCSNMDGLGGCYAKCNKSDRERQILYYLSHMWNIKNKQTINQNTNPTCTVDGNVNWCGHYGKQYGGFSKKRATI